MAEEFPDALNFYTIICLHEMEIKDTFGLLGFHSIVWRTYVYLDMGGEEGGEWIRKKSQIQTFIIYPMNS